ncbi:Quinone oxidoreductase 2 [Halomonadaceae bacterium LMG 33818]|uniref:SDR family oxidoreductase n=1 Tax=Cernens ardua TaxID=3402176 RepID=UPI003EDC9CF0
MIAVTGANGQLGRLVVEYLLNKTTKENLLALVRSPEKAADLGISTRSFDYDLPEELPIALANVDVLVLISSSEVGKRTQQHRNVIEAAKKAQVKRIVYTSLLHADTSVMPILPDEHKATETLIKESGIDYTILRNGWYTENYTDSAPSAVQHGALLGSAGDGRISSATRSDYAEAAAVIATTAHPDKKIYELAGDHAYTLSDLAEKISQASGKDVPYVNLPENEYAEKLVEAGLPKDLAGAIAQFDIGASKGALYSDDKSLSKLIGRPTTPLSESVQAALDNQ